MTISNTMEGSTHPNSDSPSWHVGVGVPASDGLVVASGDKHALARMHSQSPQFIAMTLQT